MSGEQTTRSDLRSMIRLDVDESYEGFEDMINKAFVSVMNDFPPVQVTERQRRANFCFRNNCGEFSMHN